MYISLYLCIAKTWDEHGGIWLWYNLWDILEYNAYNDNQEWMLTGYNHITVCNQQHDNVDGHSPAPTGAGFSPYTEWLACQKNVSPQKMIF